jgi:hypothetical protein
MPSRINGRYGVGGTPLPAATPQRSPQAPAQGRPASSGRPEGLAARNLSGSAGMAPRQRMPQAWQPPALGGPAHAHAQAPMAAHFARGGSASRAFGGGGFLQAVRNVFQGIREMPQQLQQLAQQASRYSHNTMQQAMQTAQIAIHGPQPMPYMPQPMPYMPQPMPYMPPHAPAVALGVPVGLMPLQPAPWHHPAPPMAMHTALEVQHTAQQFMAQAHAFDAASLSQQIAQMNLQMQTVQNCVAQLQQTFQANQAQVAGAARPGRAAAYAM